MVIYPNWNHVKRIHARHTRAGREEKQRNPDPSESSTYPARSA
ncbi:MAG TPA: hypothetical protein VHZ55_18340 [Bryobacteraceae bacterium]|nr:hypothetical protein [Bryobacteraceae bacterium]